MKRKGVISSDKEYYYDHVFPWSKIIEFVTCRGRYKLGQRVFWFELPGGFPTNRMVFSSERSLRLYVLQNTPINISMSAIWPVEGFITDPESKRFVEKEIVLDIDMNDYSWLREPICACGDEKRCCDLCWIVFIRKITIPYVKHVLEDIWGFKEIYYVYSGRRGIHIHIQDERAMLMNKQQRTYAFRDCTLYRPDAWSMDHIFRSVFREYFSHLKPDCCSNFWKNLNMRFPDIISLENATDDIIVFCLLPKFDEGFFKDLTHNIKVPWSIHKDTNNVCVFIEDAETFLPSKEGSVKYTNLIA